MVQTWDVELDDMFVLSEALFQQEVLMMKDLFRVDVFDEDPEALRLSVDLLVHWKSGVMVSSIFSVERVMGRMCVVMSSLGN